MITRLKEIDRFLTNAIHEAVFLRDTAGPTTREQISKRLGFTKALEWVAHYCLNQIQHSNSGTSIGLHPKFQILPELRMEDSDTLSLPIHPILFAAVPLRSPASVFRALRVEAP